MAPSQKATGKSSKASSAKKPVRFSKEEYAAMRDYVEEKKGGGQGEAAVLAKIAEMGAEDRAMGNRIHKIIMASVPSLMPKLWYGMPAYAKDDKVVCFFQPGTKFKTRYSTLGFSDKAKLDEGNMWPNSYALMNLTTAEEAKISALVKRAVS